MVENHVPARKGKPLAARAGKVGYHFCLWIQQLPCPVARPYDLATKTRRVGKGLVVVIIRHGWRSERLPHRNMQSILLVSRILELHVNQLHTHHVQMNAARYTVSVFVEALLLTFGDLIRCPIGRVRDTKKVSPVDCHRISARVRGY